MPSTIMLARDSARAPGRLPWAQGRAPAGCPQVVERDRVLVGVHALPEALVAVGAQLAARRPALERLALEHAVAREVVEHAAAKQKKPPLIQCSERGFSRKPRHAPVARRARSRRTGARGARRSSSRARRAARGTRAAHRGRCRRGRRRRSRRSVSSPLEQLLEQLDPPAGLGVEARVHAPTLTPCGPLVLARRSARSARPCSRWRAGSGESPGRRTAGSRARRSACRRSPPAAWGSPGCAPAGGCRARRRGSRRAGRGGRCRYPATRSSTSAETSKLACTAPTSSLLLQRLDQPHQLARLGLVDRHEARRRGRRSRRSRSPCRPPRAPCARPRSRPAAVITSNTSSSAEMSSAPASTATIRSSSE